MDFTSIRREARYGMPAADQTLFNRHYILGYSYYFRQAKWALEIIDTARTKVERLDNFRPDYRLPEMFRVDLQDYSGSGLDRGHLVASANQRREEIQNSETFLLSNMSPQRPNFNRQIWGELEEAVRQLANLPKIMETYVICGPIFYFDKPVEFIGLDDDNEISVPIPNAYFKSILTESNTGSLKMWSFILPNEASNSPIEEYLVTTHKVEKYAGIQLWGQLEGSKIQKEKNKIRSMW